MERKRFIRNVSIAAQCSRILQDTILTWLSWNHPGNHEPREKDIFRIVPNAEQTHKTMDDAGREENPH